MRATVNRNGRRRKDHTLASMERRPPFCFACIYLADVAPPRLGTIPASQDRTMDLPLQLLDGAQSLYKERVAPHVSPTAVAVLVAVLAISLPTFARGRKPPVPKNQHPPAAAPPPPTMSSPGTSSPPSTGDRTSRAGQIRRRIPPRSPSAAAIISEL